MKQIFCLSLGVISFVGIILISGCNKELPSETSQDLIEINWELPGPATVIYKTRKDYYNFVPVGLSEDKTKIISFPHMIDVYHGNELRYPTRLHKGYLLDKKGIWINSAFLNITYEEYSKFSEVPSPADLLNMILDDDPFTEMYYCGSRYNYTNVVKEINRVIDSNRLDIFEKLR